MDSSAQNHADTKADDFPHPIPKVMDTLEQIGNNVGEETSKAATMATEILNKTVRENSSSDKK